MQERRRVSSVVVTVVMVVAVLVLGTRVYGARRPAVGALTPDFTLATQDGKSVSLKDYRGKWVVLFFYPANFTRMGTLQAQTFQKDLEKYARANAAILGVSVEDSQANKDFAAKANLTFPLLSDPDGGVAKQYGSTQSFHMTTLAARNTFIIDPNGRVAQVFLDVDPEHHSPEVLQALGALQHH